MDKSLLDTDTLSEMLKGKNVNVIQRANDYYAKFGQIWSIYYFHNYSVRNY